MARVYRVSDKYVPFNTELLSHHAHDIATQQLIPRIAKENTQALLTVQTPIFYFQRLRVGRRCSCSMVTASSGTKCSACFNTLVVGGYNKWGTTQFVIDVTQPNVRAVNVMPLLGEQTQPKPFGLVPGAVHGFIEVRIPIETNIGKIDALSTFCTNEEGLRVFLKSPADSSWVEFETETLLESRLFNSYVDFRFEFSRNTILAETPRLYTLYVRYKRRTNCTILANVPRNENSIKLSEMGASDDWKSKKFWIDSTIRSITTEDFFAETLDPHRWKVISTNDFAPEKLLVSWDVEARLVQAYEAIQWVPLGT